MFRLGGNTDQGIMSGVAPRQGYDNGELVRKAEEEKALMQKLAGQRPDTSMANLLIDFGLNVASAEPRGSIFSTAADAAKEPFQRYQTAKAHRGAYDQQIGLAAARSTIEQRNKMAQIAEAARYKSMTDPLAEMKNLAAEYLDDYAGDWNLAMNKAKFFLEVRPQLATAFGESQVGGIIDQDELADEKKGKQWMKRNQSKIGQVFYDVNDGQIKRLILQPGTNTPGFEVIDPATLTGAVADTDTQVQEQKVVSTGMSDAQAETEAAKRGYTLITRPDDASRGWLTEQKRLNPNAITKTELEEVIRMEEFSEATEHLRNRNRSGTR
jgi:hypothetical protein